MSTTQSVTDVTLSTIRVHRYYQSIAALEGRNNALFRTALFVRDTGWSLVRAIRVLLDLHIAQPTAASHVAETPEQRRREGLATLRSAFSRPPRQSRLVSQSHVQTNTMSNGLREHFLQLGVTAIARVLDGLVMVGIKAGQRFTEKVACALLQPFRIGRRTIQQALSAKLENAPLQPPVEETSPDFQLNQKAVEADNQQQKCVFVRGANRVKSGGRPAIEYVMPHTSRLCRDFAIDDRLSDSLQPPDLISPLAYRLAMQRALIQRRPGQYSRQWLGKRIGVSKRTLRRYDHLLGLDVHQRYETIPITWRNLDAVLPDGDWPMGTFLQTANGKRFPPVRGLAARLLKRDGRLLLCRQTGNIYALGTTPAKAEAISCSEPSSSLQGLESSKSVDEGSSVDLIEPSSMAFSDSQAVEPVQEHVPHGLHYCSDCITPTIHPEKPCKRCGSLERGFLSAEILADVERTKAIWSALWNEKHSKKALSWREIGLNPAQIDLANRLYFAVRRAASPTDERQWLSEKQARKLVAENPASRVEWAITLLGRRGDLRRPAAFAYAIVTDQRNRRRKEQSGNLLADLATSPYLQYFANADQITEMYEAQADSN